MKPWSTRSLLLAHFINCKSQSRQKSLFWLCKTGPFPWQSVRCAGWEICLYFLLHFKSILEVWKESQWKWQKMLWVGWYHFFSIHDHCKDFFFSKPSKSLVALFPCSNHVLWEGGSKWFLLSLSEQCHSGKGVNGVLSTKDPPPWDGEPYTFQGPRHKL